MVTSPLTPAVLNEAGITARAAAVGTEQHNHIANDLNCQEQDWVYVVLRRSRRMATMAEKHTPLLPVWPLSLLSVLLCQKERVIADLFWQT